MGTPLYLAEWTRKMFSEVFGWKKTKNGKRRYTIVYCEIPRWNAKSTTGAAVANYLLVGDGENNAEVYCAAASTKQATKVFKPVKIMVKQNDELRTSLRIYGNSVYDPTSEGTIQVVSADGGLQHGHKTSGVIFDELHTQPNGDLYEAFSTSLGKREQPLMLIITTAGVLGSFAEEIHNYAVKVRDGIVKDDAFLPIIYGADPEDDPFSEEVWKKANPGWDYINQDEFRSSAARAKESAVFLNSFKRYHLNIWTGTETVWLEDETFMQGTEREGVQIVTLEEVKGRKCFGGLDLASNRDTTSAIFVFPPVEEGERWKVLVRVYIPESTLYERADRETVQYLNWAADKHIILTPGKTQDYEFVRNDIVNIGANTQSQCIGFDSWNANETVQLLEKEGVPMMPYSLGFKWMNAPMQYVDSLFRNKQLEHGGHPVLRWHNQCMQAENKNDFIRPKRKNANQRIDAMVAMIVAFGTYLIMLKEEEEKEKSIVKTKGITSIQIRR